MSPVATPEVHQLLWGTPITCYAFNADRTKVAVCPNNSDVQIWSVKQSGWEIEHTLSQHDKLVTGIDWAPETNRIVSCSQDRNAYVWELEGSTWKPTMVVLRINRAATCVKWSPRENKFAVGSGAKLIAICYFAQENDCWVAKHVKKNIKSTVLSIDWHPKNNLIACGSADMKVRVFPAWIDEADGKREVDPVWGSNKHLCAEYTNSGGGWVHGVAFSPSGNLLAWVGHNSSLNVADPVQQTVFSVKTQYLPLTSLLFLTETSIVAAGHDCVPYLFEERGHQWEAIDKLDHGLKKAISANTAMLKFRQMDSRATTTADVEINSQHQNTISDIRGFVRSGARIAQFTTSGVDGKLVIWHV